MATERVVEREVPVEREVHVVHGDAAASSGTNVGGIIIALVLLAAVIIGGVFLMNMSRSEAIKDNAVANAATNVGDSVSEAAGAVTDAVTPK
jgi:hypothetical protein